LRDVLERLRLAVVDDETIDLQRDGLFDQLTLGVGVLTGLGDAQVDA
jgi:hypothetical protein